MIIDIFQEATQCVRFIPNSQCLKDTMLSNWNEWPQWAVLSVPGQFKLSTFSWMVPRVAHCCIAHLSQNYYREYRIISTPFGWCNMDWILFWIPVRLHCLDFWLWFSVNTHETICSNRMHQPIGSRMEHMLVQFTAHKLYENRHYAIALFCVRIVLLFTFANKSNCRTKCLLSRRINNLLTVVACNWNSIRFKQIKMLCWLCESPSSVAFSFHPALYIVYFLKHISWTESMSSGQDEEATTRSTYKICAHVALTRHTNTL